VITARWSRLATLGLLLATLGPVLMLAAALLWGMELGGDAIFFLITVGTAAIGPRVVSAGGCASPSAWPSCWRSSRPS